MQDQLGAAVVLSPTDKQCTFLGKSKPVDDPGRYYFHSFNESGGHRHE